MYDWAISAFSVGNPSQVGRWGPEAFAGRTGQGASSFPIRCGPLGFFVGLSALSTSRLTGVSLFLLFS